jgi:hypothetical protein
MACQQGGCRGEPTVIEQLKLFESEWLSQDEVKYLCHDCYLNMVKNNITRVRKSFLMEKLNNPNSYIEVTYIGPEKSTYNFGGHSLRPFEPKYFQEDTLPVEYDKAIKLLNITINKVKMEKLPDDAELKLIAAKKAGKKGIMWVGASPRRTNDHGTFIKGEPYFDLPSESINYLKTLAGFKVIE